MTIITIININVIILTNVQIKLLVMSCSLLLLLVSLNIIFVPDGFRVLSYFAFATFFPALTDITEFFLAVPVSKGAQGIYH